MKNTFIIVLFQLVFISVHAQYNLVPNPSFEVYDTCPEPYDNIRFAVPWFNPVHFTSPDYMNACDTSIYQQYSVPVNFFGSRFARTGVAYAAIINYTNNISNPFQNNYREYIETELLDSLTNGVSYCIRFYVSSCDSVQYTCNDIGIYFSTIQITDSCPSGVCIQPFIPQIENPSLNNLNNRTGWTLVSGTYLAHGGERFIVIGNFKDSLMSTGTYTGWAINPIWHYAAYYLDDILISPCDSLNGVQGFDFPISQIRIFPTIAEHLINVESKEELINSISLYTSNGKLICKQFELYNQNNMSINIDELEDGLYIVSIVTNKSISNFKFIKIKKNN